MIKNKKEDLNLMKDMGVDAYRFSISWARILPKGTFGDINQPGIQHYNNFINALLHVGQSLLLLFLFHSLPDMCVVGEKFLGRPVTSGNCLVTGRAGD